MMNQILCLIFMTLGGTAQGLAMEFMMEKKNEKTNSAFRLMHWTLVCLIGSIFNIFVSGGQDTVFIRMFLHWFGAISAVFLYYRQPLWQRMMAVILLFFAGGIAEIPAAVMIQITKIDLEIIADRTTAIAVLLTGWGTVMGSILCMIVSIMWKRFFYRGYKMKYFSIILLSAVNHWITFFIFMQSVWEQNLTITSIWSVLIGIVCIISWLVIAFSQTEKEEMEHRLREEKRKTLLEKSYYDGITNRREEIASVVRKNNKEVQSIHQLLENGRLKEAEKALKELAQIIDQTKDYKYCEIPVVNAILSEKQKECEENNIILNVKTSISQSINIKQLDMCSILGNLLDNAIRACKKVNLLSDITLETVQIDLVIKEKGNFLIIKCTNPTIDGRVTKFEGTGYGLKIIQGIANQYKGNLHIEQEKERFTAQVVLQNQSKEV